jgi:antibiotic biosynthesis monooxygenase (ABM) superfamily enzyme
MIERHVTFNVHSNKTSEFEKLFVEEYRPAMSSMLGFVKGELLCEQGKPTSYQMVIRFETVEASAAWRNSVAHQSLQPKIKSLYKDSKLQVYDVVA